MILTVCLEKIVFTYCKGMCDIMRVNVCVCVPNTIVCFKIQNCAELKKIHAYMQEVKDDKYFIYCCSVGKGKLGNILEVKKYFVMARYILLYLCIFAQRWKTPMSSDGMIFKKPETSLNRIPSNYEVSTKHSFYCHNLKEHTLYCP